jgi:hypothetical protein
MSSVVESYLAQMEAQREAIFDALAAIPEERLWERPQPKVWSAGEELDHTRVLNRSFRRFFALLWPVFLPVAKLRSRRTYETAIDNVYQRPNMPMYVGFLWPPHYKPERPTSVDLLHDALALEHERIARFYRGKEESLLGNAYVWDPAIGRLNYIQALRVGIYHDQHHYDSVRHLLQL